MDTSRRKFLKAGLEASVLAASGLLFGCSGDKPKGTYSQPKENREIPANPIKISVPEEWSFLYEKNETNYENKEQLYLNGVPIGPQEETKDGNEFVLVQKILSSHSVDQELNARGWTLEDNIENKLYRQVFGIPNETSAEHHLKYAQTAIKYLYEKVKGLKPFDFEWEILKQEKSHINSAKKAYIGKNSYRLYRADFLNNSRNQTHSFYITLRLDGAFVINDNDKDGAARCMYLSTGGSAIFSPFSEGIPITTYPRTLRWGRDNGKTTVEVHEAEEAISESLSHILSKKLANELPVPNGEDLVMEGYNIMIKNHEYVFVPQAVRWVKQNGIQNAFDLYMENPQKFMEAIKK